MSDDIRAYADYMRKEALMGALEGLYMAFSRGGELTADAVTAGAAIAALAGAANGWTISKLTSPGRRDFRNVQRATMKSKLEREVAKRRRELELADMNDMASDDDSVAKQQRSLRL